MANPSSHERAASFVPEILVWDRDGIPAQSGVRTALWRSYGDPVAPEATSIPRLVETHAEPLRRRYLAWVHDLGETLVDGRRLADRLEIRPNFSYWWLTPLVEKCNYEKSPWIDVAIKLMAFDAWAGELSPRAVRLASADRGLAECLRIWCAAKGIDFFWSIATVPTPALSMVREAYRRMPATMRACAFFARYAITRWPLRGAGTEAWKVSAAKATFVSYYFNLARAALKEGRFECHFWGTLPEALAGDGCSTNWLHVYVKSDVAPTARHAAEQLSRLNDASGGRQVHVALDSFLGVRVLRKTLRDWLMLALKSRSLQGSLSQTASEGLHLWPLFAEEWQDATAGAAAVSNLLVLNLFEAAMASLPKQALGVYLQENQAWEGCLLQTWKSAGHGQVVGFPHSTVRFWDLRYFFDRRSIEGGGANPLPRPDKIAVNGAAVRRGCLDGNYSPDRLVEVEALRYLYLVRWEGSSGSQWGGDRLLRVLVLTDYSARNTRVQMRLLERAAPMLPQGTLITIKPHPACPVAPEDYPNLMMTVTMEPVAEALKNCNAAYTSAATSAAVDAYLAGVTVVSMLDGETVNQSPLLGYAGISFASTPTELAKALKASMSSDRHAADGFFNLDEALPRWRKLIGESSPLII